VRGTTDRPQRTLVAVTAIERDQRDARQNDEDQYISAPARPAVHGQDRPSMSLLQVRGDQDLLERVELFEALARPVRD
jgi:hypothetical protein